MALLLQLVQTIILITVIIAADNRKTENEILSKKKAAPFKSTKKTSDWRNNQFTWDKIRLSTALEQWSDYRSSELSVPDWSPFQAAEKTTDIHQPWMSSEVVDSKSGKLIEGGEVTSDGQTTSNISGDPFLFTTVSQYATFHSPMLSRPNHLLGPLHGPDWILDKSKLNRKKPLDASTGIEGTLLWAVGLFGTVQNGAIVFTGIFSTRFRQPLHILICTLAAADFFVSFIYIPTYTYFLLEGAQPQVSIGEANKVNFWSFCNVLRLIFIEIASVTLTIKVLISLYLYILTYSKKVTDVIFSYKNTFIFILLAWISNFGLLFVPNFLGLNNVDFYPNAVICIPKTVVDADDRVLMAYTLLTLSLHIVELLVISLCFSKVLRAIQLGCNIWGPKRKVKPKKESEQSELPASSNKCDIHYHRAKRITVLFFVTFVMCWLPIYLVNLVDPTHSNLPTLVHHFAMDMLLLKSAINPAIYVYGIRALRREMKVVCMCRCDRKGQGPQTFRTSMDSFPSKCDSTKSGQMV